MKILLLTTAYKPLTGGSELAIEAVTQRLSDCQFDIVTARHDSRHPAEEKQERINIFRVGRGFHLTRFFLPKTFLPLAIFWKAHQLMRQGQRYDLVHVFQASQAAGAAWLLKFFYPRLPMVLTLQEGKNLSQQNYLVRFFRKLIFGKMDRVTAISHCLKNYLIEQNPAKIASVIPNGVNWNHFSQDVSRKELAQLTEWLGIKPGAKTVISVSRLVDKNGLAHLVEAMAVLKQRRPQENYHLLLAGEGYLKKSLMELVNRLNLDQQVTFAGMVSQQDLPKYLRISQIFVRPSSSEGLGNSFLEAMAAGVPVIGPAVGGIPDFLTDGQTGLFSRNNPLDIAQKIEMIFDNEELRQKIISQARDLIKEKYHWDQIAQEYRKIYAQLI